MVLQNIFAFNKIYCNSNIQFDTFIIIVAWASAVSDSNIFNFSLIIWTHIIISILTIITEPHFSNVTNQGSLGDASFNMTKPSPTLSNWDS